MAVSKAAGRLVPCERPVTIADGLRGRMGDLTWPIIRDFVDDVIIVTEEEIVDAMQLCYERMKVPPAKDITASGCVLPNSWSSLKRHNLYIIHVRH